MYSVFVVDDEMIVRESLRSKLNWEEAGFTFAGEAADGEIALSMIQDIKPDILITDIRMPFMDGLELSARVKKMQPWIRIIILSGHDEFDYAKRAISIGVDEYLLKPFTLEELRSSLGKVARALEKGDRAAVIDEMKSTGGSAACIRPCCLWGGWITIERKAAAFNSKSRRFAVFAKRKMRNQAHLIPHLMALHGNFDTIAVKVHFGASGCIRVHFVPVFVNQ